MAHGCVVVDAIEAPAVLFNNDELPKSIMKRLFGFGIVVGEHLGILVESNPLFG